MRVSPCTCLVTSLLLRYACFVTGRHTTGRGSEGPRQSTGRGCCDRTCCSCGGSREGCFDRTRCRSCEEKASVEARVAIALHAEGAAARAEAAMEERVAAALAAERAAAAARVVAAVTLAIAAYSPVASFVFRSASATGAPGGSLEIALSSTPREQTVTLQQLVEMTHEALDSLQGKDGMAEQRVPLETFLSERSLTCAQHHCVHTFKDPLQAYHAAVDLHAQRVLFESIGHPDFCRGDEERSAPGTDATALNARVSELKATIQSWNKEISATLSANDACASSTAGSCCTLCSSAGSPVNAIFYRLSYSVFQRP